MTLRPFLQTIFALSLMLSLSACQPAPLTAQEHATVTELTTDMKIHCVGRYLIDMPADIETYGSAKLRGIDAKVEAMTQEEFLHGMRKREAELKATKSLLGYQFLYGDKEYPIPGSSTKQLRSRDVWHFISLGSDGEPSDANRVIEAYKWDRGYRIKLNIEGSDFAMSRHKDEPWVKKKSKESQNDVPSKLQAVLSMLYRFRALEPGEIPKDPGVCLTGGFIQTSIFDQEEVSIGFHLLQHQDVYFKFKTDTSLTEKDTLLQRASQIKAALKSRDGKTLRKGSLDSKDLPTAEEWLASARMHAGALGYFFMLEANSLNNSAKTPLLSLNMKTGVFEKEQGTVPEHGSLTEGEAIAVWDAISRSIRMRPEAMDFKTVVLPRSTLTVPIVSSGEPCPESGHWITRCDGEPYSRLVFKGNLMPSIAVMQAVPYRWLPKRINTWLAQRQRLPMTQVEREVRWILQTFLE
ncbi:hypothetical protein FHW67_001486 [Herbaspirillum sp. Sphag1AN]|uniref:T6SS immunity protein Tli4 family protein n=1 Tax=unclassified Herbaspirillum TaxID=2624150 RepID=UPI00161648FD|nr:MULTISPECIES: T6SS immunity protein Tli4 family protein [unclassified Herbaspirillum]MBB3212206.1 hypothetical protein [Herbaspirillum sp. Sphag1AN]MBB3245696.1 hypothetical protein [Herbaspirillum sp. Sphag64]